MRRDPSADPEATAERALRPSRWRTLLNTGITLLLAAGLITWAARGIAFDDLRARLEGVTLSRVLLPLVLYALLFFATDVLGFGLLWRRLMTRDVPWSHVPPLVCGKQVLCAVAPVLTKLVAPIYFWRHLRIPPLRTFGTSEILSVCELGAVVLLVSVELLFGGAAIGPLLTPLVVGFWAVALALLLWLWSPRLKAVLPSLRKATFLHDWVRLPPRELLLQLGLRLAYQFAGMGCVWLLLAGMGARLSLAQIFAFGPLLLLSSFMAISMAGYGGPQGVAVALLADAWGLMPRAQAMAFSLLWSTALLLIELVGGALFVPWLVRLLRTPGTSR
jgi:hypothetical protein